MYIFVYNSNKQNSIEVLKHHSSPDTKENIAGVLLLNLIFFFRIVGYTVSEAGNMFL